MKSNSKVALACIFTAAVGVGAYVGYRVATNPEIRSRLTDHLSGAARASRHAVEMMSEDVALKKAKVTNNPKVNQDWVERQWDLAVS